MIDFGLQLTLLSDILERKRKALEQILNITENQETILKQEKSPEMVDFFNQMAAEKQTYVDIVLQSDSIFQRNFDELKDSFDSMAEHHLQEIKKLQTQIAAITDFDVAIRIKEKRNKELAEASRTIQKAPASKVSKNYMLQQYEKNKIKQ